MNKIDWKSKLTSRKLWAALVGFVTAMLVAFGAGDETITQVTGIIMAGATLIAYIIGEGMVDVARLKTEAEATDKDFIDGLFPDEYIEFDDIEAEHEGDDKLTHPHDDASS